MRARATSSCDAAQEGAVELEVTIREQGEIRILELRGKLILGEPAARLHQEMQRLLKDGWRKIVVNLSGVSRLDSSGISTLVRNSTALIRAGGSLKLVCPAGRVREALEIMRLLSAIPTFESEAQALASF